MKFFIFSFLLSVSLYSNSQNKYALIPQPLSVKTGNGSFELLPSVTIVLSTADSAMTTIASLLSKKLSSATGYSLPVMYSKSINAKGNISLSLRADTALGDEGYLLDVTAGSIVISAAKPAGLFYGCQTLLQLLPKEIENNGVIKNVSWTVPVISIKDKPRFAWRGLMLDVSRHFFTVTQVKDFIDNMVRYKYNLLHLHLTDDQGWRIQIKALPRLTAVGAWRVKRTGKWGNTAAPDSMEPRTYGGFYTHEDIEELLQYARERFVNILPEIDVPGHSMAAIASYPELSCTPGAYHVNAGDKFMQWHGGGKFSALVDNNLCPAKESVYDFLDTVFTEVAQLFPFQYIHIGGDEAAKNIWEQTDTIQSLMTRDSLETLEQVQRYFVQRVQKIVESKGKKVIGWDEILEGGLDTAATVMSWRGMKGGIAAAQQNHKVVMSPSDFVYLDLMQGDKLTEPNVYSTVRLSKTYQFDPVPAGINQALILGGQGNLWTEQIPQVRALQYMLWPRALALAECVWSARENKNYNSFIERAEAEMQRLDIRKIKYAKTMYEPLITASYKDSNLIVKLETEVSGLTIYYSYDETNPDEFYPEYKNAINLPKDAATLKLITYRNGKPIGRQINIPISELEKRAGRK